MTKILKLRISYPVIDTASSTEEAQTDESIHKLKTQELQLCYQDGRFYLNHADRLITLGNDESFTINELIISTEADTPIKPAALADSTETNITDLNIPSLYEDVLTAEINKKLSAPLEAEAQTNHIYEDDPLAFLYVNPTNSNLNSFILPIKEKAATADSFKLLNQHFQPPRAVTEQNQCTEKIIYECLKI